MAITLGTNISAYTTRNKLNGVVTELSNSMQRLSTGSKINKAGDDPASLVISKNMEANIRASKQAMNNIQNANAFLTVAEDGMVAIGDHLQRINDLLTNMANDTNDETSRTAAVNEIIERLKEVDRLVKTTNFNGRKILDSNGESIYVQMGADSQDESVLDIAEALSNCRVSVLGITLPDVLDPNNANYNPNNINCRDYMAKVQVAINEISSRRGLLGAYENRLESSYECMSSRILSLEVAKSYYTDADVAEETTNLTQKQIMEQINVSILASANNLQQMALSLLG